MPSRIRRVQEVATGLWHWQAPHPEWADSDWPQLVSSYAIDDGERLLLFDPIAVPDELMERSEQREPMVVLTSPWHERDTRLLVERHAPPVFVTDPGEGSPDVEWLMSGEAGEPQLFSAGGGLPAGIEAFPGREPNDVVLWVPSRRAVVAGDTLVDFGDGLMIHEPWLSTPREQVVEQLRPLLDLPVEHILATHGGPHDRAALERALA
jgi:glyoxylase-like metal-dependent hydrolase (beta-lactamase superfamily II)